MLLFTNHISELLNVTLIGAHIGRRGSSLTLTSSREGQFKFEAKKERRQNKQTNKQTTKNIKKRKKILSRKESIHRIVLYVPQYRS